MTDGLQGRDAELDRRARAAIEAGAVEVSVNPSDLLSLIARLIAFRTFAELDEVRRAKPVRPPQGDCPYCGADDAQWCRATCPAIDPGDGR